MASKVAILLLALGHLEVAQSLAKPEPGECLAPTYMTRFSAKLFQGMMKLEDQDGNVVFSPFAVHAMLALIYSASEGETLSEVQRVGEFNQHPVFVALDFERLIKFKEHLQSANLTCVSKVFYNQKLGKVNSRYDEFSKFYFEYCTKSVDMDVGENRVRWLHFWTQRFDISSPMQAILTHHVEFHGFWKHKFERGNSRISKFHLANGETFNVDMMYNHEVYGLADLPELDATALELPFEDSATSMLILLPNQLDGLANLEEQLAQPEFDLNRIANRLHRQSVTVGLPWFRLEFVCDMGDPLKKLGLNQMFTGSSKVTKLLDQPVRLDKILQSSDILVAELGTLYSHSSGPDHAKSLPANSKEFVANRPFVFAIRTPNSVLLMGHVKKPK
ncbi:serine protease inhibitor 3/4-like [Drosophila elegans]|uniref:serine protease inhibitor 3/4-like n=1 Tax=Drosophila elegans TaxID=30023 RepID=UPI001BC858D6|nr:serine protease inhibitor 3/4-like [Drosophila elegans]